MKKLITLGISLLLFTTTHAQWWGSKKIKGNGNIVTKERSVSEYDAVKVAGNLDVDLVAGNEGNLTLVMDENLLEYVKTEVKDNALKVYVKKGYNIQASRKAEQGKILIIVPVKDISSVALAGSGDVNTKDFTIKASDFKASVAGSGDVNLNVNASNIDGKVAGSGDLRFKGDANSFSGKVTGSGDIHAFGLVSEDVEAYVTGSGDVRVYCKGKLKARVTGSGDITYKGNPAKEDSKVTGSGDISKG